MQALETLGSRVCIFGPSNAGKSTLAAALGEKLSAPVFHLDLLHHRPNTDWVPRDPDEFERLHDAAIAEDRWVMEGNYSRLMPKRLQRATGIVWIETAPGGNLWRYLRRTLFERDRIGAIEGGQETLKWLMIRHITLVQPRTRARLGTRIADSGLPYVRIQGMGKLNALYAQWGLRRPRT